MANDPKEFAEMAATALDAYVAKITNSYWDCPDPDNPTDGTVELSTRVAEDMLQSLPIIAQFLRTMFEEVGGAE